MRCKINLEGSRDEYKRLLYFMFFYRGLIARIDVLNSVLDCFSDDELEKFVCKYLLSMIKDWSNKNAKI